MHRGARRILDLSLQAIVLGKIALVRKDVDLLSQLSGQLPGLNFIKALDLHILERFPFRVSR
jgi:hypothetical protein